MKKSNATLVIIMLIVSGVLMHMNNVARSSEGITSWYSDPSLITQGNIYYIVFYALLTGFVIVKLLGNNK